MVSITITREPVSETGQADKQLLLIYHTFARPPAQLSAEDIVETVTRLITVHPAQPNLLTAPLQEDDDGEDLQLTAEAMWYFQPRAGMWLLHLITVALRVAETRLHDLPPDGFMTALLTLDVAASMIVHDCAARDSSIPSMTSPMRPGHGVGTAMDLLFNGYAGDRIAYLFPQLVRTLVHLGVRFSSMGSAGKFLSLLAAHEAIEDQRHLVEALGKNILQLWNDCWICGQDTYFHCMMMPAGRENATGLHGTRRTQLVRVMYETAGRLNFNTFVGRICGRPECILCSARRHNGAAEDMPGIPAELRLMSIDARRVCGDNHLSLAGGTFTALEVAISRQCSAEEEEGLRALGFIADQEADGLYLSLCRHISRLVFSGELADQGSTIVQFIPRIAEVDDGESVELGQGSYGVVHKAAVKFYFPDSTDGGNGFVPAAIKRLKDMTDSSREKLMVETARTIIYNNGLGGGPPRCYGFTQQAGLGLVMEYIDGGSLKAHWQTASLAIRSGGMPYDVETQMELSYLLAVNDRQGLRCRLHLACLMLEAIEAIHSFQLLHRDLHMGNFLIDMQRGVEPEADSNYDAMCQSFTARLRVRLSDLGISAAFRTEAPAPLAVVQQDPTQLYVQFVSPALAAAMGVSEDAMAPEVRQGAYLKASDVFYFTKVVLLPLFQQDVVDELQAHNADLCQYIVRACHPEWRQRPSAKEMAFAFTMMEAGRDFLDYEPILILDHLDTKMDSAQFAAFLLADDDRLKSPWPEPFCQSRARKTTADGRGSQS